MSENNVGALYPQRTSVRCGLFLFCLQYQVFSFVFFLTQCTECRRRTKKNAIFRIRAQKLTLIDVNSIFKIEYRQ